MRKLIYSLFLMAGICASAFTASANVSPTPVDTPSALKSTNSSEKLYFSDVIKGHNYQLYAEHYSHSSHSSHWSHSSHSSHYSGS